jgi:hypothetical protein
MFHVEHWCGKIRESVERDPIVAVNARRTRRLVATPVHGSGPKGVTSI